MPASRISFAELCSIYILIFLHFYTYFGILYIYTEFTHDTLYHLTYPVINYYADWVTRYFGNAVDAGIVSIDFAVIVLIIVCRG